MNNAIVIGYVGRPIVPNAVSAIQQIITSSCDATPELMTIKAFDADSIAKALLKKSAEDLKISFTEDSDALPASTAYITFNPKDCEQKLRIIKCVKESIHCSLKEAKDMVDCGKIYIPKSWSDREVYNFIKDLRFYKVTATGGMEDITMIQAAIFLNENYGSKDGITLVIDFAAATYHSHTNSANEEERALLAAVELVKNHPASAVRWVFSELINVINSL